MRRIAFVLVPVFVLVLILAIRQISRDEDECRARGGTPVYVKYQGVVCFSEGVIK